MTSEAEQIAAGLTDAQRDFLERVACGHKLKLADRQEDRVRQKLRRIGLVWVLPRPRRWTISPLGACVRAIITTQGESK